MNILKRILSMIFPRNELKNTFGIEVPADSLMSSAVRKWAEMLTGGKLRLPAAVVNELARLTAVEMKIGISGSARADYLNACVEDELPRLRRELPKALALGTMIIKPYYDGRKLRTDYVSPDCFIPTAWNNAGITGAVFAQKKQLGNKYYTRLEHHNFANGLYTIKNAAFVSGESTYLGTPVPLSAVPEWAAMAQEATVRNVSAPLFGVFRVPAANTIDPSSPLGVSAYHSAEKVMGEAEKLFENLLWEFESGERRLYVDFTALRPDSSGKPTICDRIFRSLDVDESDFFKEWSPEFRNEAIQSGLNVLLRRVEFITGLAYGTLSEINEVDKTAEEIRASKQRSYANVCDLQRELKTAIEGAVYAMDVWAGIYNLAPSGKYSITAEFDDSIVADRKAEFAEKMQLVTAGIMPMWEFRMWYFGEDEKTAKEAVANGEDISP